MSEANHMAMNVSRIAVSEGACPARPEQRRAGRCPPGVRHIGARPDVIQGKDAGPSASEPNQGEIVMAYETIRYERGEHIGTLTLARPEKRNAQNPLMWRELADLGVGLLAD